MNNYEMDPASSRHRMDTVLSSGGWTDAQTDARGETLIPHFQLQWKWVYDKLALLLLSKNIIGARGKYRKTCTNGENILKITISWP